MRLKDNGYELELAGNEIKELEEKILESGMCNFTVPMWFSRNCDKVKITYECSGYVSLRDLYPKRTVEIFEIIEKTMLTLNRSIEFYIPSENVTLNLDTVYFSPTGRRVKIAYRPDKNNNIVTKIDRFLDELESVVNDDTKTYLQAMRKEMPMYNKDLKILATYIGEQRKKILRCLPKRVFGQSVN